MFCMEPFADVGRLTTDFISPLLPNLTSARIPVSSANTTVLCFSFHALSSIFGDVSQRFECPILETSKYTFRHHVENHDRSMK